MQQNLQKNKNILRATFLCTFYLLFTSTAFASELSLGVDERGADGTRDIAVLLRSTSPINALEGALLVPANAQIIDISDAGSPVQFWIEHPRLSDTKDKILFSGIIPGGFSGEAALFHIRTNADPTKFIIDKKAMRLLLNDGAGTSDSVKLGAEKPLPVQFVLHGSADDKTAPNPFTPQRALLPTESGERESLVFTAHDDASGVLRYEIAYSPVAVDPSDPSLLWTPVDNPVPLESAQSNKFIYVKAIDHAGNIRIAEVPPTPYTSGLLRHPILLFFGILSVACVCIYCVSFFFKRRTKRTFHK